MMRFWIFEEFFALILVLIVLLAAGTGCYYVAPGFYYSHTYVYRPAIVTRPVIIQRPMYYGRRY